MHVVIAKVDEVFYDGEAYALIAPGSAGQLTVLSQHMPLVTTLKAGEIIVEETAGGVLKKFPVTSGVLEVRHDGATVIL
jgi:F-type H+-transporting ATPase subunit epsilon